MKPGDFWQMFRVGAIDTFIRLEVALSWSKYVEWKRRLNISERCIGDIKTLK